MAPPSGPNRARVEMDISGAGILSGTWTIELNT